MHGNRRTAGPAAELAKEIFRPTLLAVWIGLLLCRPARAVDGDQYWGPTGLLEESLQTKAGNAAALEAILAEENNLDNDPWNEGIFNESMRVAWPPDTPRAADASALVRAADTPRGRLWQGAVRGAANLLGIMPMMLGLRWRPIISRGLTWDAAYCAAGMVVLALSNARRDYAREAVTIHQIDPHLATQEFGFQMMAQLGRALGGAALLAIGCIGLTWKRKQERKLLRTASKKMDVRGFLGPSPETVAGAQEIFIMEIIYRNNYFLGPR